MLAARIQLAALLLLTCTALWPGLVLAQAQKTVRQDVKALMGLFRSWRNAQKLAEAWVYPGSDPCAAPVGLECAELPEPINGRTLYVKALKLGPVWNVPFNISGTLPPTIGDFYGLQLLDLSVNRFSGSLPPELSKLTGLTYLDLSHNQFNGTVPAELGTLSRLVFMNAAFNNFTGGVPEALSGMSASLEHLLLQHNQLGGPIPTFLASVASLREMNLAYNQLSLNLPPSLSQLAALTNLHLEWNYLNGSIPPEFGDFHSLKILKLSHNFLSGPIPTEITKCTTLQQLMLNHNYLTGQVPDGIAQLPNLMVLSLQYNNFTGTIPPAFGKIPSGSLAFLGNSALCVALDGSNTQPCQCSAGESGNQTCDASNGPGPCICPTGYSDSGGGVAAGWVVLIVLGAAALVLLVAALGWWGVRTNLGWRRRGGGWEYAGKISGSFPDVRAYRSQAYDPDEIDSYGMHAYEPMPKGGHPHDPAPGDKPHAPSQGPAAGPGATAAAFARKFGRALNSQLTMRHFSFDELQLATNNFSPDSLLGSDAGSRTYSGVLPSGTYIAVKELQGLGGEPADAFAAAVEMFSNVRCQQLVQVLGFCAGGGRDGLRYLVYELMRNGSLDFHLHDLEPGALPLNWATRMSVALQVAKGLTYLHSMSPQLVHQRVQASSVLLDDNFHAKLSDYCLDSLRGPASSSSGGTNARRTNNSTNMALAAGTAAPELAWSPEPTARTDVYAFGVLLLEIVSGRRPIDSNYPPNEQSLVRWAKPKLTERSQVESMADRSLGGAYSSAGLYQVALLASQCIHAEPESRPLMVQAVEVLQNVQGLALDRRPT